MTNALWYVTNHHSTFQDAARIINVIPIPEAFKDYKDFNDEKKKKISSMNAKQLESHSQASFALLLKPVIKSSPSFSKLHDDIQSLAECFHCYSQHLEDQSKKMIFNHNLPHPVRTVGEHTTAEHRRKISFGVKQKYILLDKEVSETDEPVFFYENRHTEECFENHMQFFDFSKIYSYLYLLTYTDFLLVAPSSLQGVLKRSLKTEMSHKCLLMQLVL